MIYVGDHSSSKKDCLRFLKVEAVLLTLPIDQASIDVLRTIIGREALIVAGKGVCRRDSTRFECNLSWRKQSPAATLEEKGRLFLG